ncbi:biotin--[acetyl-CoA-carboxylase] ligase [uncultured Desulfobacter sp.]|uniref:biotin--[acetyl-CoA-carboxylase] ligase n=1 Tax=uncultured Desulfobacter sp. TaxID=240139 RepID=UPI002AAAE177|nr:biotin--[acetyl-CoA-carboxylase] ligase [uncultured Desulfobacter sp.]
MQKDSSGTSDEPDSTLDLPVFFLVPDIIMKTTVDHTIHSRILTLLFTAPSHRLSIQDLTREANLSQTQAETLINEIKVAGIPMETTGNTYTLIDPEDLLSPCGFDPETQNKILHYLQVPSTMTMARTMAEQGAAHMSCCVAEQQSAGRGRMDRSWLSPRGGLWFSLIMRPQIPPAEAYIFNFAAAVSLHAAIRDLYGLDARVKWPNDLLLDGKKLTGLLSEIQIKDNAIGYLITGIGINVNNTPVRTPRGLAPISLKEALGKPLPRRPLLKAFLSHFTKLTSAPDISSIMASWKSCSATIGARVTVETHNRTVTGTAVDVDDSGTLMIRTPDGKKEEIIYGDCFHT